MSKRTQSRMIKVFTDTNSIINQYIAELRDVTRQGDRMRFRRNLERFGEIAAYEISKHLTYKNAMVETPFGEKEVKIPSSEVVITGILRAGLPLHQGLLNFFDQAGSAFVSTYRNHKADGSFKINLEYVTAPNLEGKDLIISDPMLATGSTISETLTSLLEYGKPASVHVVTVIACTQGIAYIERDHPNVHLWVGSVDDELTAKSYIVPGLGDAGDLCFGEKKLD